MRGCYTILILFSETTQASGMILTALVRRLEQRAGVVATGGHRWAVPIGLPLPAMVLSGDTLFTPCV